MSQQAIADSQSYDRWQRCGCAKLSYGARFMASAYYKMDWITGQTALWTSSRHSLCGVANGRMLEIGSYEGRSAIWFLENILTAPTAALTCDDLIYIGGHRAIDAYIDAVLSWPLLKVNGFIIFDDYLWEPEKPAAERPQAGIDRFLQEMAQELALRHKGYQVITQKREGASVDCI